MASSCRARSGPDMQQSLAAAGIYANTVTRQRSGHYAGCYVADFCDYSPGGGVQPAATYAAEICRKFPDTQIISTYDSAAHWREGCPILSAMVIFR